jgi:hypothetical protein
MNDAFEMIASSEDLSYFVDADDLVQNKNRFINAGSDLLEQGVTSSLKNTIKSDLCF